MKKRLLRRIAGLLLATVFSLSFVDLPTIALSTPVILTASSADMSPGKSELFTVSMEPGGASIGGIDLKLTYNADAFELETLPPEGSFLYAHIFPSTNGPLGTVRFLWDTVPGEGITDTVVLFTLSLKAKPDAPSGRHPLELICLELYSDDVNMTDLPYECHDGEIALSGEAVFLTGLCVGTPPHKTTYIQGEDFDWAGLTLTAQYSDGSSAVILGDWEINCNLDLLGESSVSVSYGGLVTEFIITVLPDPDIPISKAGDVNKDGAVDLKDVTALSRSIAGWSNFNIEFGVSDINGDGQVDLKDVTALSRFIAGWNVNLGIVG